MNDLFHNLQGDGRLFEPVICFFLLAGGVFCLGGSIGMLRFPDIYCKMQALSKPVTLGIFNLIIAYIVFLFYAGLGLSMKGLLAVVFLLLTIPIGSHMMIKGAYRSGVPIWTESLMDQLADTRAEKIVFAVEKEAQTDPILTDRAARALSLYTREWASELMNPLTLPPKTTGKIYFRYHKKNQT